MKISKSLNERILELAEEYFVKLTSSFVCI